MQASTRYTKAIHICIYLNIHRDEIVSSRELAESLVTNAVVIRKLLKELRDNGIVESVSGPKGGFRLALKADDINLWKLYLIMRDEDFFQRPKVNPDCVVSSNLKALVYYTFTQAELNMKLSLEEKSIRDLTKELKSILKG